MKKLLASTIFLYLVVSGFSQTKDIPECRKMYEEEKYEDARTCYASNDQEIFSVYMCAYISRFLEDKKAFKTWSKKLYSDDFHSSETYYYGAYLYPTNSKKFLKTLDKGLKEFPNDTLLLTEKINYYITIKDYEKGIPIIEELLPIMTNDLVLYTTAGSIYNWIQKDQKAIPYFEKALEIDPADYDSNYGLGLIYYNQAADLILSANETLTEEDTDGLIIKAKSLLKKSLPYLEIAFKATPDDKELKSALLTCYSMLQMEEEYEKLMNS